MDCELNMMESRISPKKTAADYQKRSILPDLEQRAQLKDDELRQATLRHEALHERLGQLELQLLQRQQGREHINMTSNLEQKQALLEDELSRLTSNLSYISQLGPLIVDAQQ